MISEKVFFNRKLGRDEKMFKICFIDFYDRVYRNGARVEKALKIHRQNLQRKAERDQV